MSESFQLGGDPAQIRVSARQWAAFSQAASTAWSGIRSLDTADFQGDEAETYQDRINSDLPQHLDTASTAWNVVAVALSTYASELEAHQRRMSALAVQAGHQQATVNSCRTALNHSQQADRTHSLSLIQTRESLGPGEQMPVDGYVSSTSGDRRSLHDANTALQATFDAASKVRSENAESVRRCRSEIDRAKGMRFAKPPGFWGRLAGSVCDWISDHADVLLQISSVLKTISGIAGMLALLPIPGLQEVMGGIALVTGGAALIIDAGVKLATGRGSWTQIGLDALSMIPGARAAKLAFAANTAYGGYQVATGNESLTSFALNTGMGALAFKGGGRVHEGGGARSNSGGSKIQGPGGSRGGTSPDQIQLKLEQIRNQAVTHWNNGVITYTPRQRARLRINKALGGRDFTNTFKGSQLDKWVKNEVRSRQHTDPDLGRVYSTRNGEFGPDFINTNKKPGEQDWYDLTTKRSWNDHVSKYSSADPRAPQVNPGSYSPSTGRGTPVPVVRSDPSNPKSPRISNFGTGGAILW